MSDMDIYTKDGTTDSRNKIAKKNKTGTWNACRHILATATCEKVAYYGMSTTLLNYIVVRFNQGSTNASKQISNWMGTVYVTPLLGAFIADAYLGRFCTIAFFLLIYSGGLTLLTLTTFLPGLKPHCEDKYFCHPTKTQTDVCFLAMYIIAIGAGGMKPCVTSFGADQFDDTDVTESAKKSSYFNWLYFSVNVASLVASTGLAWLQQNEGWTWGFGIPSVAIVIAALNFYYGTPFYRHQRPGGSSLTRIFQVVVASLRKWRIEVPEDTSLLYETTSESIMHGRRKLEHTEGLRFFDKAAVDEVVKAPGGPWKLCTVTQVEELKSIIRLLPIWATGIVFSIVYGQVTSTFTIQGYYFDNRVGGFKIPASSLLVFDYLSVLIWIPLYDYFVVPTARRVTKHESGLTLLQRMGTGLVISILAMLSASMLEFRRLEMVRRTHSYDDINYKPISVLWQIPQYTLIGCAEVFSLIGQMHLFYDQAPDAMRSFCTALSLTNVALGQYGSTLLINIVTLFTTTDGNPGWVPQDNWNYGHLDSFYLLLASLSAVNFVTFLYISQWYTYRKATETSMTGIQ